MWVDGGWSEDNGINGQQVGVNQTPPVTVHRARGQRARQARGPEQMTDDDSEGEGDGFENEEDFLDDVGEGDPENPNGVKHVFRDSTWGQNGITYEPRAGEFLGSSKPKNNYRRMPTYMYLFNLFWPWNLLPAIVVETNRYATEEFGDVNMPGGPSWTTLTVRELRAFIACCFFMGMKKQPHQKTYWEKKGSFFRCPRISNIFSRDRFQSLVNCLHLTNPATYVRDRNLPGYDKMGQVRWVVEQVRDNCKKIWSLRKYFTIDDIDGGI
jgi:hypothetical protein